jgi:hypothetical protein
MSKDHTIWDAAHEAMHHVTGVPEHQDRPKNHHGMAERRQSSSSRSLQTRAARRRRAHFSAHHRSPRVLVRWQTWIAGLVSRKAHSSH